MVFEHLIKINDKEHKHFVVIATGIFYSIFSYITARFFFSKNISIAIIFLITLLSLPALIKLLALEERVDSKDGTKDFFKNHKYIFQTYLFFFIGVFMGFFLLCFFVPQASLPELFSYQTSIFYRGESSIESVVEAGFSQPAFEHFLGVIYNNLTVIFIMFILAFFYGAGSIFLVVLNASVFSIFIFLLIQKISEGLFHSVGVFLVFMLHMVPEVFGFLLASIAGGVLSVGIFREKIFSERFRNVAKDALLIFLASVAIIIIAALIESFISRGLILSFF